MIDTDSQGTQASLCRAIASCCFMQYVLTIVSADESFECFERHFYKLKRLLFTLFNIWSTSGLLCSQFVHLNPSGITIIF